MFWKMCLGRGQMGSDPTAVFAAIGIYIAIDFSEHKGKNERTSVMLQDKCGTTLSAVQQVTSVGVLCHWQPGIDVCRTTTDANGAAHVKSQCSDKGQIQGWVWAFCEKQIRIDFVKIMVPSANPGPFIRQFGLSPPPPGCLWGKEIFRKKKA